MTQHQCERIGVSIAGHIDGGLPAANVDGLGLAVNDGFGGSWRAGAVLASALTWFRITVALFNSSKMLRVAVNQSTDDVIGLQRDSGDLDELEEGLGHALGARGAGVALINRVAHQFRQIE